MYYIILNLTGRYLLFIYYIHNTTAVVRDIYFEYLSELRGGGNKINIQPNCFYYCEISLIVPDFSIHYVVVQQLQC